MIATTTPEADRIQNPVVLSFHDLDVKFTTEFGTVHAVQGISLDVRAGEIVALVGESGSGKSVTSMTSMGLLPRNARTGGSTRVGDAAIEKLDDRGIRRVRGARSEEHTSELQSRGHLVCRLLLEIQKATLR